jgi:hypothetical protein
MRKSTKNTNEGSLCPTNIRTKYIQNVRHKLYRFGTFARWLNRCGFINEYSKFLVWLIITYEINLLTYSCSNELGFQFLTCQTISEQ